MELVSKNGERIILVTGATGRGWKNPGRSSCCLDARIRPEPRIKDSSPDDGDAMNAPWRPSHSLALAHASISYLVDPSLGARCRYWAIPLARTPALRGARAAQNVVGRSAPFGANAKRRVLRPA